MKFTNEIIYFKIPELIDKENVEAYIKEFKAKDLKIYGTGGLDKEKSYEDWLKNLELKNQLPDLVPATQFLVYRCQDNRLIGMVNIRHYLNKTLKEHGGHIGQSVRPSEQGKGYGTMQIALALKYLKQLNQREVLMTCNADNIASIKSILNNGGVEDSSLNKEIKKFWIKNY